MVWNKVHRFILCEAPMTHHHVQTTLGTSIGEFHFYLRWEEKLWFNILYSKCVVTIWHMMHHGWTKPKFCSAMLQHLNINREWASAHGYVLSVEFYVDRNISCTDVQSPFTSADVLESCWHFNHQSKGTVYAKHDFTSHFGCNRMKTRKIASR